jgi:acetoin utilization protein AcuC
MGWAGAMKAFIFDDALDDGGYPPNCPFDTARAGMTYRTVSGMGLLDGHDRRVVAPVKLTRSELERFHHPRYLDALERGGRGEHDLHALSMGLGTPDCPLFADMFDYVSLAAGGSVTGAKLILSGEATIVFNPSGGFHHAHPARASGFCYVNDVVLACQTLAAAGRRVLFLDVDAHHGDGVQDAFYDRRDVMTVSMHQSGRTLFPGTGFEEELGHGEGYGFNVNLPLPVGTYDAAFLKAFDLGVLPVVRAFDPDVIVLELGMDALAGDPLAHLQLSNNAYADVVQRVRDLGKPILATGGGGYHVENTVRGWALCWSVLCGDQADHDAMSFGMGGVLLETTDWSGGLRDRMLITDAGRRSGVDVDVDAMLRRIRTLVFPLHGIDAPG